MKLRLVQNVNFLNFKYNEKRNKKYYQFNYNSSDGNASISYFITGLFRTG